MKKDKSPPVESAAPRTPAGGPLAAKTAQSHDPPTLEQTQRLLHELQVHQVEVEMQNAELLRTREEFERSRNKYAEFYELAPVCYFTFDTEGVIREVNLTGA